MVKVVPKARFGELRSKILLNSEMFHVSSFSSNRLVLSFGFKFHDGREEKDARDQLGQ